MIPAIYDSDNIVFPFTPISSIISNYAYIDTIHIVLSFLYILKVICTDEYYCEYKLRYFCKLDSRIEKHPDTIRELNSPISRPRGEKGFTFYHHANVAMERRRRRRRNENMCDRKRTAAYRSERIETERRGEGERKNDEGVEKGEEEMPLWKNITCWTAKERELRKHDGKSERRERKRKRERECGAVRGRAR